MKSAIAVLTESRMDSSCRLGTGSLLSCYMLMIKRRLTAILPIFDKLYNFLVKKADQTSLEENARGVLQFRSCQRT